MVAHVILPKLMEELFPTISKEVVTGLLRKSSFDLVSSSPMPGDERGFVLYDDEGCGDGGSGRIDMLLMPSSAERPLVPFCIR